MLQGSLTKLEAINRLTSTTPLTVPINSQTVPQKSQFVPRILYLFSKCVNVIRVQNSDRNMDESIFRTIYIMLRAPYVNFTMHC